MNKQILNEMIENKKETIKQNEKTPEEILLEIQNKTKQIFNLFTELLFEDLLTNSRRI